MIERPISAKLNVYRDTVTLFFEKTVSKEFYIRGAVAWPEGTDPGMAVLGAQDIRDKTIWVFEGYDFLSITPIFQHDKKAYNGLAEFLIRCWTKYSCFTFFWRQGNDVHQRYALKCYDEPTIQPKPEFIRVPYTEEDTAANLLKEYAARKKLKISKQSELYQNIADPEKKMGTHALRCLLAGFEFIPWVDYEKRQDMTEYIL